MSEATMVDGNELSQEASTPTRKIDPGFSRNMKIIGGVVLVAIVAVALVIFSMMGKSSAASGSVVVSAASGLGSSPIKTTSEATPAMQQMLAERQQEEAAQALAAGKSYAPKESIGNIVPVNQPTPLVVQPPQSVSTMQVTNATYAGNPETDRARIEGLQRQISVLVPDSAKAGQVRQTLESPADTSRTSSISGSQGVQSLAGASGGGATQNLNATRTRTLIQALEIYPAQMTNPINVAQGKSIFASARINGGPFDGAYLTGLATFTDEEVIETVFNSMRHGKNFYRIDAIVLDEQTAASGLKGNVDRRLLQRYAIPITLAIAQGFFTAKAQTGSQVIVGAGGVTAQSVPAPTEQQAVDAGFSNGLKIAQGDADRSAAKPIRGSTERGAMVGILFRSPVVEEVPQ